MRRDITLAEAGDILTTAIESGYFAVHYWADVKDVQRGAESIVVSITLSPDADADEGDFSVNSVVDQHSVKKAWRGVATAVAAGKPPFSADLVDQMVENSREAGEAGGVDALVADCLVQIALMGEVVFG